MAVLKHVRFPTMEEAFLRDTVRAWPALLSIQHALLHMSLAPVVDGVQPLPRLGFGPPLICLVGGHEQDEGTGSTVWAFDPELDTYCEVSSMATRRHTRGHGAAALGGKLYVMGGFDDHGPTDGVPLAQAEVYDPKADDWQLLPSMLMARCSLDNAGKHESGPRMARLCGSQRQAVRVWRLRAK